MTHLIVRQARLLRGEITPVGDKSISHRALILGALADGTTAIDGLSPCVDVARTQDCLRALGVPIVRVAPCRTVVDGRGLRGLAGPPVALDCGDSGTTMRLLAGILASQDRPFTLLAADGLARRPMARVVRPLRAMGADIAAEGPDGRPPIAGRGGRLHGADITLEQASAQVGSACLLAALNADGATTVRYPAPVRDHTERLLAEMGAPVSWSASITRLDGPVVRLSPAGGGHQEVPGDLSAAAFLLAAAALVPGATVRIAGVGLNPGRTGILDVLAAMGAPIAASDWALACGEPRATLSAGPGAGPGAVDTRLVATVVERDLVPRLIDELPLVAVLATQAHGRTVVRDAAELRVKETDRVAAIVDGLSRLGARIAARPDGFTIDGPTPLVGAEVEGHGDHRIVMALAVAGLVASGHTSITDAERIGDSYPGFVEALVALGADVQLVS